MTLFFNAKFLIIAFLVLLADRAVIKSKHLLFVLFMQGAVRTQPVYVSSTDI